MTLDIQNHLDSQSNASELSPTASVYPPKRRKINSTSAVSRGVATLTPEQLAKKRANDREAQRAIRERTKTQIETLETKIRELTSQQPYQELQVALRQKQAVQAENEEIRKRLSSILAIIQPILGAQGLTDLATAAEADSRTSPTQPLPAHDPANIPSTETGNDSSGQSHSERSAQSVGNLSSTTISQLTPRDWAAATVGTTANDVLATPPVNRFAYQKAVLHHGLDFAAPGEKLGLGFLLDGNQRVPTMQDQHRLSKQVDRSSRPQAQRPYTHSQLQQQASQYTADGTALAHTVPLRNIPPTCPLDTILLEFLHARQREAAEGASEKLLVGPAYPSVSSLLNPDKSIYSHPLSQVFTDILSKFPDICGLPEQVAVLYVMFLIMRWSIYPTQENYDRLPEWVTPRPSQLFTPHPVWIDYLPFPRMRDKLVANWQSYPFENWFIPYTTTLSLNWPYEPTDVLLKTSEAEDLMINPVFERHLRDLKNWSLGPQFAKAHPALADTVRIKNEARRSLSTESLR